MPDKASLDRLRDFLRTVPPFNFLSKNVVEEIVLNLVIEYFPKGEIILDPQGDTTQFLYIIRSGGVKILSRQKENGGDEKVIDYRDEGEFFGFVSLLSGEPSPLTIVAEEDTICYLLKKELFKKLLAEHPNFLLYFTAGPSKGFRLFQSDIAIFDTPQKTDLEVGQILFTCLVKDVMRSPILTCSPENTVVDAARRMTNANVGSVIVVNEVGVPVGIMTDEDLRVKLIAAENLASVPVKEVMSKPIQSIPSESFCFEAFLSMIHNRVKYLIVMEKEQLVGIISEHDLMLVQGNNPVAITKQIEQAENLDQLVIVRHQIEQVIKVIFEYGGTAKEMCQLVTSLNDHLTQKVILLAEKDMVKEGWGPPPVPYAWVALGSEGRREQTLVTDQDNAIVFSDGDLGSEKEVQGYFLKLAEKVVSGLERSGFPRCKGGMMAVNPQWCRPYRVWRDYFRNWILRSDDSPLEVMIHSIFFDLRCLYGEKELVKGLIALISECLSEQRSFLRDLAENAIYNRPPLGFFKKLVVEKTGEHRNQLNLKNRGLTPLVEAVRVLALDEGIFETNTLDRISILLEKGVFSQEEADGLKEAFNVLMLLRLRHHATAINQGKNPDNFINPAELSLIQRTMLKEAFKAIDQLQDELETHFGLLKVM
ncbi:MAG TPA: putative nucleotidyltransferase substrate binding domain-containing protein [Thermodesulfobacteriota bacterium]|nr:putative nucleotidyltransferase substrate binding domain-containing protein [Thermodesulfobacteriota bacterium]